MINIKEPESVNSYGVNSKIKAHILDDEKMKEIGFRLGKCGYIYCKHLINSISLYIRIPYDFSCFNIENDDLCIRVIDDDFGQPYDYQYYIASGKYTKVAEKVYKLMEIEMEYLKNCGVITGYERGDYI